MVKSKDLLPTTGYVHGGCSPIGMKKAFKTSIDSSAKNFEKILANGGVFNSSRTAIVARVCSDAGLPICLVVAFDFFSMRQQAIS